MKKNWDVIVIGGGHAGIEAALASARIGADTLLLTQNLDHIGQMSCNPCIGGIAKGHVVREIDALGGEMGQNADATSIQFRMLNSSRGRAVWSPRCQSDKILYQRRMKHVVERTPNLSVHMAEGMRFIPDAARTRVAALETIYGDILEAKAFVICSGTFLRGLMHFGPRQLSGGRQGDPASDALSKSLSDDLGLELMRLKTGTPCRILARSIDFAPFERQDGEEGKFSFFATDKDFVSIDRGSVPQMACWIGHTSDATKKVIEDNLHLSPMYNGTIKAIGTRYCPSIEDKVSRFADKSTHQVFLEPEGAYTEEYYLNGVSTSLPIDVQVAIVKSIPGLEKAEISRYAYAVEYDVISPHQTDNRLGLKAWPNLFTAGQINGTSGYEEAGGQGLVAGANAALHVAGKKPLTLTRDSSYIGVMVDDLVTKDITEPYRLFTSRAEYRLLLRQDNADRRLCALAAEAGLLSGAKLNAFREKEHLIIEETARLRATRHHGKTLWETLGGNEATYASVVGDSHLPQEIRDACEADAHYEPYIKKELALVADQKRLEDWVMPLDFDYSAIPSLGREAITKLNRYRPSTLGSAARIDGVNPADIALLQVHLKRGKG